MSMSDISFDRETGRFVGISDHDLDVWQRTWRTCDIRTLISIAEATVKHQPEVYPASTIWRRMLCTKVFPYGKELLGAIPLQIETESDSVEKRNPKAVRQSGLDGEGPKNVDVDSHILACHAPSLSIVNKELIGNLMDIGFIKLSRKALNIALQDPKLFNFLVIVAGLARYSTEGFNPHNLEIGQAFIKGCDSVGLTNRQYRTVKQSAIDHGFLKFENRRRGTIATFLSQEFLVTDKLAAENRQAKRQAQSKDNPQTNNDLQQTKPKQRQAKRQANDKLNDKLSVYTEEGIQEGKYIVAAEARRLTDSFFDALRTIKPDFKAPDLDKWALEMDRLLRIDKRSAESVQAVIDWLPSDEFWRTTILSPAKLRKQFDQLEIKRDKAKGSAVVEGNKKRFLAWKTQFPDQLKSWVIEGCYVKHRYNSKEFSLSMQPEAFMQAFEAAAQQR